MKNKLLLYIIILCAFVCCNSRADLSKGNQVFSTIDSLIKEKDFFAARDLFRKTEKNLSRKNKLLLEIFLYNAFNQPENSDEKIEIFMAEHKSPPISDSMALRLKSVALDNSIKTYNYDRARKITVDLLTNYSSLMDEEKVRDHENTLIIWTALKDQPKQEVHINNHTELNITKDKAGLPTLSVNRDTIFQQFVFDTGANFSTITESTAKTFGLEILDGKFEVNSITGSKIYSRVALAPEISIGDIMIRNAVFLVFPDEALGFEQIDYQINGIIGFPVIEAMKEIQITRDGRFIVPLNPSASPGDNLAIDFLTPLIYIEDTHGSGPYTFDTGAGHTMLYNTYYERFLRTTPDTLQNVEYSFGGAGGNIIRRGSYIPFNARIGKANVSLDSVIVIKEEINANNRFLGNIGQDLMVKFEKMTLNFEKMFIRFD